MRTTKSMLTAMYAVLKNELKLKSLGYKDVAEALGVSVGSIGHRFADRTLTMEQIMVIADLLGKSLTDLMQKLEQPPAHQLTFEQESALAQDMRLILVLVRVMDEWPIDRIVAEYDISKAECIKHLLELDRLHLIDLLPNNIVRKRFRRTAEWQPNGPLQQLFATQMPDFLNSRFDGKGDAYLTTRASLTASAVAVVQADITQMRKRAEALHEECKSVPEQELHHIVIFAAEREWEVPELRALRRKPENSGK